MTLFDWSQLDEWGTAGRDSEHIAMPVVRPSYVDPYLENLVGPNEQHEVEEGHCINPKCRYKFSDVDMAELERDGGEFRCPKCGYTYDYYGAEKNPTFGEYEGGRPANPGGMTHSGLTLDEMGEIGEGIIARMGELPGVGAVAKVFDDKHNPIDAIVQGQKGQFGCEIKSNHSTAQERFKVGGAKERQAKIIYCLTNGLKPALIGVRLNFYTDKAYVFFREGLTDTWIGNAKMLHVATVDFADLNPFKSPDMQAQALAVDNANLPDQSDVEFEAVFGAIKQAEDEQPRDDEGKFTFKEGAHELKVADKKGKHHHTIKRCKHCGVLYETEPGHKGRIECPSCGEDPERKLAISRVVLGASADDYAKQLGFNFLGHNAQGHRQYDWEDSQGTKHVIGVGSGAHGKRAAEIDADRARQRMQQCVSGTCRHARHAPDEAAIVAEPGAFVIEPGTTVVTKNGYGIVLGIDGEIAIVRDFQTGKDERIPTTEIQKAAASDPDYLYVYYMGELHVEPYDVNVSYERMLSDLLDEFGVDMGNTGMDIDPTKVDAGEIRVRGWSINIEHKQLSEPEVREYAERALYDWWGKQRDEAWDQIGDSPWQTLDTQDHILAPEAS